VNDPTVTPEQAPAEGQDPAGFEPASVPSAADDPASSEVQAIAQSLDMSALPHDATPEEQARAVTEAALQAVAASTAFKQMESLSSLVLDAAEVANRSSMASTAAGESLQTTRAELEKQLAKTKKVSYITLGVAGVVTIAAVVMSAAMVVQIQTRLTKVDATLIAVGKRVVELNASLQSMITLSDHIVEMQGKQEALTAMQSRIDEALKTSQTVAQGVSSQTAKEVEARTQALVRQVQALEGRMQAQATAVKSIADQMRSFQGNVQSSQALQRDVEALVTLQRERVLENLRAQPAAKPAESVGTASSGRAPAATQPSRGIQYPRVNPAADAASAPNSPLGPRR